MGHVPKNSGALRTTPNEALNAILNLPSLYLAGMETAKSAAIRLRDTGQSKTKFYGHAKIFRTIKYQEVIHAAEPM